MSVLFSTFSDFLKYFIECAEHLIQMQKKLIVKMYSEIAFLSVILEFI